MHPGGGVIKQCDWLAGSDEESIDILRAIRKAIGSAKVTLALMEVRDNRIKDDK